MTTPRPGSRAEQRHRTEARILDAATQVFFSAGYDRTTIRAVASAAGVDAGLVMHYFGSKQELFRRVIDAAPVPEVSGASGQAAEEPAQPELPVKGNRLPPRGQDDRLSRVKPGVRTRCERPPRRRETQTTGFDLFWNRTSVLWQTAQ